MAYYSDGMIAVIAVCNDSMMQEFYHGSEMMISVILVITVCAVFTIKSVIKMITVIAVMVVITGLQCISIT